jgi:hypothetical protein
MYRDHLKGVYQLAQDISKTARHAKVNEEVCVQVGRTINRNEISLGGLWGRPNIHTPCDLPMLDRSKAEARQLVAYELYASAVNYRYWFGRGDVRPNSSDATKMYKCLDGAFNARLGDFGQMTIQIFFQSMSRERFPALSERSAHLAELASPQANEFIHSLGDHLANGQPCLHDYLDRMIAIFPGFGADLFLKRASLFFMMLNRRMGWFSKWVSELPMPADYQMPKMLRWMGCIVYDRSLEATVKAGRLIPSGSRHETEIRAATILAAKLIADAANCTVNDVDSYLWLNRKSCSDPFHLTITTDY